MATIAPIPVHGNYYGYYSKRPFIADPRLALLPPTLLTGKRVLDVGCNEGWVTCEIAQSWRAQKAVGVDIDETLIRGAWRRRRTVWSLQSPDDAQTTAADFHASDINQIHATGHLNTNTTPGYFPASFEHSFGPLSIPPFELRGKYVFPHNISFRAADWVNNEILEDREGYDVVIAFSISKWIHLNDGDDGLLRFFRRVHSVLASGGYFVLEPQAWGTYTKAKRIDESLKEHAKYLKLRPDEFETILRDIGFGPAQHLGTTGEGGFLRPVDVYMRL